MEGIRIFNAVVACGSFTRAAERLGISKALVSKYVQALEDRLGVRLLQRSTRRLSPTEAGSAYFERSRKLLEELDELESGLAEHIKTPQGRLVVSAPAAFGNMYITGLAAEFISRYPSVSVDLRLVDRYVNLIEEGFDVAVRIGELKDSALVSRRLATFPFITCAAPEYLARHPAPRVPQDLQDHDCIIDTNYSFGARWPFRADGKSVEVTVDGRLIVNGVSAVREAMLAGCGIGRCPDFLVGADLKAGRLVQVLAGCEPPSSSVFALYPNRQHLPAKVRTFVDFIAARFAAGVVRADIAPVRGA